MHKSLLQKYLAMTMAVVLASYIVLGTLMMLFFSDYWQSEKREILLKSANATVDFTSSYIEYNETTDEVAIKLSGPNLYALMALISSNIESNILIVDLEGNTILGSSSDTDETDIIIEESIIEQVVAGTYESAGTLSGLFQSKYYTIGVPLTVTSTSGEEIVVAVVFASTNASGIAEYTVSVFRMFLTAALLTLLLTFIVVWAYTYKMIGPLRRMSQAAKAFGEGDFSVRVPVESSDEIGQLSLALNNMANSLSNSEGMRRSFVANVSHELKTPMTTIGGFIDGILDGTISKEKQPQYLKIVSDEVKRLARLVKSMLDLSKIDSGEMKINPVKFDITSTVFTTLLTFEQKIDEKNFEIRGLEEIAPINIHGDQDLIHQVIYNLFENAVKFTPNSGYIKVIITDTFDRVCVGIENSGQGIPPEDLPLIFDKFYKSDKSRSQDKNGMGLGLYLVKTIIKLHGGDITVQSAVDNFTRFEFYLPKNEEPTKNENKVINLSDTAEIDIQDVK